MTPGQLVKAMAVALNVPEETVVQHDRNLVVAGLRTKGGRGPSAPEVTLLDAARLLVATLASKRNKDSVATVRAFEHAVSLPKLFSKSFRAGGAPSELDQYLVKLEKLYADLSLSHLREDHSFMEAVVSLIAEAIELLKASKLDELKERFAWLNLECQYPETVASIGGRDPHIRGRYIGIGHNKYSKDISIETINRFRDQIATDDMMLRVGAVVGIAVKWTIMGSAIVLVARAFYENGLPFKTAPEAVQDLLKSPGDESKKQRRKKRSPT